MTAETTTLDYWLNWRVLVCAIEVFSSMIIASILIWKYEGFNTEGQETAETHEEAVGTLYDDESWRPCLIDIHPAWLLAFRVIAFFVLLALLIISVLKDGGDMFYFYTQWTFTLVTIYFGLGSLLSIYGCHQFFNKTDGHGIDHTWLDAEQGTYVSPPNGENASTQCTVKNSGYRGEHYVRPIAGIWGYVFQIIYQTNAGAVMLTDCVFWIIIVPFRAMKDYNMNILMIGMHSINAIFLLGDTALNSLRFPWFRISYFLLWTGIYVIFQWVIHACIPIWWPYPILDLSSHYAPIWYLMVAVLHVPCYAIFPLIIKMKCTLLSSWFPHSYQCLK